jgi:dipeptidyl aminopeptidase/acylaminoacyl peptidase
MKKLFLVGAALLSGLLAVPSSAKSPAGQPLTAKYDGPVKKYTIEQFMSTIRIGGGAFSPDERKVLFHSNQSGIFNAYEIPVSGGTAKPLTSSKDNSIYVLDYLPDGRILYASDQGGNELTHLYVRNADGSTQDLTPEKEAKNQFFGMSFDKKSFFFSSNKRDKRYFDLYEMEVATFTPKLFYQNNDGYYPAAISDNKQFIALSKPITSTNSDMYLHEVATGKTRLLSEHQGEISFDAQQFTPDNKKLLYLTDEGSEFAYLKAYDLATNQTETLEKADWDISYAYLSRTGKYRVVSINKDARTEMRIYQTADNSLVKLAQLPEGDVTGVNISDSEKKLSFYINSSKSPNNLFVYDLEKAQFKQLTQSLPAAINPNDLVEGKVIRYPSFDGMEIPALLYQPKGLKPGEKRPAVLLIHGGPGGQTRLNYSPLVQYLVNQGYVILAVNNRGSSGYGKTFYAADDQKHGDADLKDCIESKKFLINTGYVDPRKIGIMGGSYGGYMTLAGLAFAPDEFAVGVDIFGVANWLRTLNSIPAWWTAQREALYKELGDPKKDSVALYNKSPLFHAKQIKKPLMVLQGANDPRVLQVESDEMVAAVKANKVPVEYIVFPDEGHGFNKKENEIKGYRAVKDFLDKYLLKPEPVKIGRQGSR